MIKKWLNRVLCFISGLGWCALLLAMLLLNSKLFIVEVVSGSMEPAIMTGERVLAVKTSADECKIGDVIVYDVSNGIRIIHRVTSTGYSVLGGERYAYVTTKGDANEHSDSIMVTDTHNIKKVVKTDLKAVDVYMEHKVLFGLGIIILLMYLPVSVISSLDAETSPEEVKKLLAKNKKQKELEDVTVEEVKDVEVEEVKDVEVGLEDACDGEDYCDGEKECNEGCSAETEERGVDGDEQGTVRYYCDLEGTSECIGGAGGCDDCTIRMEKELQDSIEGREGEEQNGSTEDGGVVEKKEVLMEDVINSVEIMTDAFCEYQNELELKRKADNAPVRRALRAVGAVSIITTSVVGIIAIAKALRK